MDSSSILGSFKVEDAMEALGKPSVATLGRPNADERLEYIPNIDVVIKVLDKVFPLTRPQESDSDRMVWIKSGQREVIEYLQKHKIEQEAEITQVKLMEGISNVMQT